MNLRLTPTTHAHDWSTYLVGIHREQYRRCLTLHGAPLDPAGAPMIRVATRCYEALRAIGYVLTLAIILPREDVFRG